MIMLKIFKPNWVVIEVVHERYTFDTYYTYCRHQTLEEIENWFMLDKNIRKKEKNGAYIYDECGLDGINFKAKKYKEEIKFAHYEINYTIVIPAKNMKKDQYYICGLTKNKFGLFDMKINSETETSTDK